MITTQDQTIEVFFTPGCVGDVTGLQIFTFDLPPGSRDYTDKAYNDYDIEDLLYEACGISLMPKQIHTVTSKGFELIVVGKIHDSKALLPAIEDTQARGVIPEQAVEVLSHIDSWSVLCKSI